MRIIICMLAETVEILRGASDPTRLRLLNLLIHNGELCVCDLERALEADQPLVSRHLAYLKHSGWVTSRRERTWVLYSLSPKLTDAAKAVLSVVRKEGELDDVLLADRRRLESLISAGSCRSLPGLPIATAAGGSRRE